MIKARRMLIIATILIIMISVLYVVLADYIPETLIIWDKGTYEEFSKIIPTQNGFITLGGTCTSNDVQKNESIGYIVEYNHKNEIIKEITLQENISYFHSGTIDEEGNIIVVGRSANEHSEGKELPVIIKYDKNYDIKWKKYLKTNEDSTGRYYDILKIADGYIAIGTYSIQGNSANVYNGVIVKYDLEGNKIWEKTLGGSKYDQLLTVTKLENGYLVGGRTQSTIGTTTNAGGNDAYFAKISETGDTVWEKTYGGSNEECIKKVKVVENEIFLLGYLKSKNISGIEVLGKTAGLILKIDDNGNVLYQKAIGETGATHCLDIAKFNDGYVIGGRTDSQLFDSTLNNNFAYKPVIWEIDKSGNILDCKTYANSCSNGETGIVSLETINNEIFASGNAQTGTNSSFDAIAIHSTKHIINTGIVTNGSITIQNAAMTGEEVTFTVTPQENYKLKSISVINLTDNTEIEVQNNKFTMPNSDIKIEAEFEETIKKGKIILVNTLKGNMYETEKTFTYNVKSVLNGIEETSQYTLKNGEEQEIEIDLETEFIIQQEEAIDYTTTSVITINENQAQPTVNQAERKITGTLDEETIIEIEYTNEKSVAPNTGVKTNSQIAVGEIATIILLLSYKILMRGGKKM